MEFMRNEHSSERNERFWRLSGLDRNSIFAERSGLKLNSKKQLERLEIWTKVDQPFKGTHQIRAPLDLDFIVVEIRGLFVKPDTFGDFYPSPKTVPQKLSRILHSLRL
jgi:hypothetical protein